MYGEGRGGGVRELKWSEEGGGDEESTLTAHWRLLYICSVEVLFVFFPPPAALPSVTAKAVVAEAATAAMSLMSLSTDSPDIAPC